MSFFCLTQNHINSTIEEREALSFPESGIVATLRNIKREAGIDEAVILSTCNRFEFYGWSGKTNAPSLAASLIKDGAGGDRAVSLGFAVHHGERAVEHLFRVAAGLESMILGENQIQGQVRNAFRLACDAGTNGFYINACFHRAFKLGKIVRSRTGLGSGATSVGTTAVEMADRELGGLAGRRVLVIGAGDIGALCLRAARTRHPLELTLANRNSARDRAARLAEKHRARLVGLDSLRHELERHDVAFSATASTGHIITPGMLSGCSGLRIYDLALPRDVDPLAASLPSIVLRTVDDVRQLADDVAALRRDAVPLAEAMVADALRDHAEWRMELAAVPSIQRLLEAGEALAREESERLAGALSGDSLEEARRSNRRLVRNLTRHVIDELKRTARESNAEAGGMLSTG